MNVYKNSCSYLVVIFLFFYTIRCESMRNFQNLFVLCRLPIYTPYSFRTDFVKIKPRVRRLSSAAHVDDFPVPRLPGWRQSSHTDSTILFVCRTVGVTYALGVWTAVYIKNDIQVDPKEPYGYCNVARSKNIRGFVIVVTNVILREHVGRFERHGFSCTFDLYGAQFSTSRKPVDMPSVSRGARSRPAVFAENLTRRAYRYEVIMHVRRSTSPVSVVLERIYQLPFELVAQSCQFVSYHRFVSKQFWFFFLNSNCDFVDFSRNTRSDIYYF